MAHSKAYDDHPQHTLTFDEEKAAIRVRVGDTLIAETRRGLSLREGKYPVTVYVPREDVRMEHLERSEHSTHCPFKGDASYFDFRGDEATQGEAVARISWSYEDPFDQMLDIRGHLAFYPDLVSISKIDR